jgi:hypothetical protein
MADDPTEVGHGSQPGDPPQTYGKYFEDPSGKRQGFYHEFTGEKLRLPFPIDTGNDSKRGFYFHYKPPPAPGLPVSQEDPLPGQMLQSLARRMS